MTATKTTICSLADDLAHGKGVTGSLEQWYDHTLERLAKGPAPFVETEAWTPTDGTKEYSWPSSAIRILAMFHGDNELQFASSKQLEAYSDTWRSEDEAPPHVYTYYESDAGKVQVHPTPSDTVSDGGDFLFAEQTTGDIPDWLVLPIVFDMLAEDFSHPSDHQDKEFAASCANMAEFLRSFTEVM